MKRRNRKITPYKAVETRNRKRNRKFRKRVSGFSKIGWGTYLITDDGLQEIKNDPAREFNPYPEKGYGNVRKGIEMIEKISFTAIQSKKGFKKTYKKLLQLATK